MLDRKWYEGREQTYIKHLVLRRYLQKLAYKVGSWAGTLNYVDCFAGPWQHSDDELKDTSPFIAIDELRAARDGLLEKLKARVTSRACESSVMKWRGRQARIRTKSGGRLVAAIHRSWTSSKDQLDAPTLMSCEIAITVKLMIDSRPFSSKIAASSSIGSRRKRFSSL